MQDRPAPLVVAASEVVRRLEGALEARPAARRCHGTPAGTTSARSCSRPGERRTPRGLGRSRRPGDRSPGSPRAPRCSRRPARRGPQHHLDIGDPVGRQVQRARLDEGSAHAWETGVCSSTGPVTGGRTPSTASVRSSRDRARPVVVAEPGQAVVPAGPRGGVPQHQPAAGEVLVERRPPAVAGRRAGRRRRPAGGRCAALRSPTRSAGRPAAYGAAIASRSASDEVHDRAVRSLSCRPGPAFASFLGVGEGHGRTERGERRAAAQPDEPVSPVRQRVVDVGAGTAGHEDRPGAQQVVLPRRALDWSVTTLAPATFCSTDRSARACGSTGRRRRPRTPLGRCPRGGG